MSKLPKILYHYTTMETLFAILSNVKHEVPEGKNLNNAEYYRFLLRASHVEYMNDPTEYNYYFDCLLDKLKYQRRGIRDYLDCKKVLRQNDELLGFPGLLSFSECEDNLPMWRSYGGNGRGVAIGFSTLELQEALKGIHNSYELIDCRYITPKELYNEIDISELKNAITREGKNVSIDNRVLKSLFEERRKVKHKAYDYEKEWRLYIDKPLDYDFFIRNGLIIPYNSLVLPLSVIKEINVGPTANIDLSMYSLNLYLQKILKGVDFKIEVKCSDVPYEIL